MSYPPLNPSPGAIYVGSWEADFRRQTDCFMQNRLQTSASLASGVSPGLVVSYHTWYSLDTSPQRCCC
jgi:hypothetical protein